MINPCGSGGVSEVELPNIRCSADFLKLLNSWAVPASKENRVRPEATRFSAPFSKFPVLLFFGIRIDVAPLGGREVGLAFSNE